MRRDNDSSGMGDPEHKRPASRSKAPTRLAHDLNRALASEHGHSGYGSESVRPFLRAQLRMKALLGTPFLPPEPGEDEQPKRVRRKKRGDH